MIGLDAAAFYDKDDKELSKINFSNLELKQIWKKQTRIQKQKIKKDVFIKVSSQKK